MNASSELFENAQKHLVGGVNSPVRAFKSVGGTPLFVSRAKGAYLYGPDDKRYIDYIGSWGPMILVITKSLFFFINSLLIKLHIY